jgi:outer membrane cobalamin receptor
MKAITMITFAIAACAGINAAQANEVRATEIIVVSAERIEQPATKVRIATEVPAPAIDFSGLAIQAPRLDRAATGEAPQRIELASGSRDVSKS